MEKYDEVNDEKKFVNVFVLDLDQTLVDVSYCMKDNCEHIIVNCGNMIHKRPHLDDFLKNIIEKDFEIIIWTAGDEKYAKMIYPILFQNQIKNPILILSANDLNSCYQKTISKLRIKSKEKGYELKKIIIYDDEKDHFQDFENQRIVTPKWYHNSTNKDEYLKNSFESEFLVYT